MLISDVTTFVVGNPPPRHGGRYFIFVKLTTDDGIDGIGEAYVATVGPHVVADMIVDVAERHLVGRRPFDIELFWRRSYGGGYSLRPDPTLCGVISAL
ncbi:MAG: mandelate racemase/muconate lactonizing enzyme family protein, partial [Actinomycetota bacterium]|nr:mandelate racemase/muconate lactonizing enzyme family protein [Actinomycetota bacterium]MED6329491.1 mandelate racemase/muconate lactonizing enzyme family protein [Actinomycetota bacterium]